MTYFEWEAGRLRPPAPASGRDWPQRLRRLGSVLDGNPNVSKSRKPKVQIKRERTSLGWAYRIYIDGKYAGAGLTRKSAEDGAKQMLARREKQSR